MADFRWRIIYTFLTFFHQKKVDEGGVFLIFGEKVSVSARRLGLIFSRILSLILKKKSVHYRREWQKYKEWGGLFFFGGGGLLDN